MSLDINWGGVRVPNWEQLKLEFNDKMHNAVAFSMVCTKLGSITDDNLPEWEFRLRALEFLGGYESLPALEDIARYKGLEANVAEVTRREFMAGIINSFAECLCSELMYFPYIDDGAPFRPGDAQLLLDKLAKNSKMETRRYEDFEGYHGFVFNYLENFGYEFDEEIV